MRRVLIISKPVTNASVYLKTSAIEFPGADTTLYEFNYTVNSFGRTTFDSLFTGNYYIYSVGFDGTDSVFGSQPIVLTESNANSTLQTVLSVSK